jgi:symplekin
MRILNEAYVCSLNEDKENYEKCLDVFVSSVVNACDLSNKMPNDSEKKRIANAAASSLPQQLAAAPSLSRTALNLVGSLCDIDEISRRASTKSSKQTIAESAALHAAKSAAEKRATAALLILRDVAFQRDSMRGPAVDCAVAIASGRLPASSPIEDKALKLVMNVIFPKNSDCADKVVESATKELEFTARYAIENNEKIKLANESNAKKKEKEKQRHGAKAASIAQSDEEKIALDRVRKPVVLFMALCVRRPEIIKVIMEIGCREGADVLAKAVKTNMPKLTKAAAVKHGMCYSTTNFFSRFATSSLMTIFFQVRPTLR